MKKNAKFVWMLILAGSIVACKNASSENESIAEATTDAAAATESVSSSAKSEEEKTARYETKDRKMLRKADLKFEVKDVATSTRNIENATQKFGGLITESNLVSHEIDTDLTKVSIDSTLQTRKFYVDNTITLRIPSQNLDTLVASIEKEIIYLDSRNKSANDVSLELLANKLRQARNNNASQRIASAIDKKGNKLNQIVDAEENVQGKNEEADNSRIENMAITDQVNFSVITLNLYQPESFMQRMLPNVKSTNAYRPHLGLQIWDSLKTGWFILEDILAFFTKFWSIALLGFLAWIGYKKFGIKSKKSLV